MIHPEPWMQHAKCVDDQYDPDMWFPEKGNNKEAQQARQICAECPVQKDCLGYALKHRMRHGIWGGTNREERWAILRKRGRIPMCKRGHPMVGDNIYWYSNGSRRRCRTCGREGRW